MSSKKINIKNFFFRKKDLLDALSSMSLVMRSCRNCTMFSKTCCVNNNFEKCIKCVRSNRDCDLAIFLASIKRIHEEQMRLKKEVRDAHAKLNRLKKQLNFLKNKKKKMIVTK